MFGRSFRFFIVSLTLAGIVSVARCDDKPAAPANADQQKAMADFTKMTAAGPEHDHLKAFVGDWVPTSRFSIPTARCRETPKARCIAK